MTRLHPRAAKAKTRHPWLRRFGRNRDGATAVEFALVMPVFLFFLTSIFQIGIVFVAGQVLEDATTEFARRIRTGQTQAGSITQTQFRDALCERIRVFMTCADGNLLVDVQVLPSGFGSVDLGWPIDENGVFQDEGQFNPGGSGDIVLVRAFFQYPVWLPFIGETMANLPNGKRLIAASAAFRNEPFGLGLGGAGS
jgi:Flp pilus assembly protein TadG